MTADAALHQRGHLGFGVRHEHDEGVLDTPVGGVGDVRDARQPVERDIVPPGVPQQCFQHPATQGGCLIEMTFERIDRRLRRIVQLTYQLVSLPPLVDFIQSVT